MKTYNVVLTLSELEHIKEQLVAARANIYTFPAIEEGILEAFDKAQPIQEKVWLPFTELKDGGTYLTRGGVKHKVFLRPLGTTLTYPYGSYTTDDVWTLYGNYDSMGCYHQDDLILELQPSEEQTGE